METLIRGKTQDVNHESHESDESGNGLRLAVPGVVRKERGLLVMSPPDRFVRFVRFVVTSFRFSLQPTFGGDPPPHPGGLGSFVVAMAPLA